MPSPTTKEALPSSGYLFGITYFGYTIIRSWSPYLKVFHQCSTPERTPFRVAGAQSLGQGRDALCNLNLCLIFESHKFIEITQSY